MTPTPATTWCRNFGNGNNQWAGSRGPMETRTAVAARFRLVRSKDACRWQPRREIAKIAERRKANAGLAPNICRANRGSRELRLV
jgi:hypothetical protein